MNRFSTLILLLAFLTTTAFAQSNQVVISFDHKAGVEPLVINQTVFSIWNNKKIKLTRAEFYISEVELQHPDGMTTPLTDQYLLVNALTPDDEFDLGTWPIDAAHGINLHLGVPATVNHNDPASWPATHPLAPQNPTMHWGWSAGYRFMAIEGKVDNNGDGIPETAFEIHNLFDALYKSVALTGVKEASNGVLHLHFVLDYAQLFKDIAMTGNLIQHGNAAMNSKMMTNAATENFLVFPVASPTQDVTGNNLQIKASPNPSNAETIVEFSIPASGPVSLTLTNQLGQTVRSLTGLPSNGSVRLETLDLSEGIYQYTFYENGSQLACKQLIIKH